jgi:hypothetical protein
MTASLTGMTEPEANADPWVSRQEAAEALGLSVKRVDQLRQIGELESARNPVTGRVSVRWASVQAQLRLRCEP